MRLDEGDLDGRSLVVEFGHGCRRMYRTVKGTWRKYIEDESVLGWSRDCRSRLEAWGNRGHKLLMQV